MLAVCNAILSVALLNVATTAAMLRRRFSNLGLIASRCLAGIAYCVAMAFVIGPELLIALQVLNAWFFSAVAGVGMTLFLDIIPRPGLASGLHSRTRRLGAIVFGPVIGSGSTSSLGYSGILGRKPEIEAAGQRAANHEERHCVG